MALNYSVWENTLTNDVFRVSHTGTEKVELTSQTVIDLDLYFAGQSVPAAASTGQLRAWLNSIPTVV